MKTKNIKVAYTSRYTSKSADYVPKLQVEGKWLSELGFTIGSTVAVEYEEGSIRIRLLTAEEQAEKARKEAEAELRRRRSEIRRLQSELNRPLEPVAMVAESIDRYGTRL